MRPTLAFNLSWRPSLAQSARRILGLGLGCLLFATTAAANEPPVALNDGPYTTHNNPVYGILLLDQILDNDSDDSGSVFLSGPIEDPNNPLNDHAEVIKLNATTIQYKPDGVFVGTDTFRYRINDGALFHSALVTVNVTANRAPLPDDETVSTPEGQPITIPVLVGDSDPDGDPVALVGPIEDPNNPLDDHGSVVQSGVNLIYTPHPGFVGVDTFRYRVHDGQLFNSAIVTVDVQPASPPPPPPPPPSLPNCAGPGEALESLAHLLAGQAPTCDGTAQYSNTFPTSYGNKCGFNIPVVAAAYTLVADPERGGPTGGSDVLDWWALYLQGELGIRGSTWHFGAKETFSGTYEWYNENAVLAVHFHARERAAALGLTTQEGRRYTALADLAQRWLKATFALQAAAAVPRPQTLLDDGEVQAGFAGQPSNMIQTYLAMAGDRYSHGTWSKQFRSMLFERAVQRPGASFGNLEDPGQKLLANTIESLWPSLGQSYGPYGLSISGASSQRCRLAAIRDGDQLPSGFRGEFLLGSVDLSAFGGSTATAWKITTVVDYTIIGWADGTRLTQMDRTTSSGNCKPGTPGKVSFPNGDLHVLYPYATDSKTAPGTTVGILDLAANRVEARHVTYDPTQPNSPLRDVVEPLPANCGIQFRIDIDGSGTTVTTGLQQCGQGSNACLPPSTAGLLGHWDFEDASNLGLDSSPAGNHGNAIGQPVAVAGRDVGEQALQLSGGNYIALPPLGSALNLQTAVTFESWIKVGVQSWVNTIRTRRPVVLSSDRFSVANYTDATGWHTVQSSVPVPVNTWYHLAGVFDQGTLSLYLNGQRVGETNAPFTRTDAGGNVFEATLGARDLGSGGVDQFFVGELDDLRMYSRALTADEIHRAAGCP